MSVTKINKTKQSPTAATYPPNYDEFFEKKAADMKTLLKRNPVPAELFNKK